MPVFDASLHMARQVTEIALKLFDRNLGAWVSFSVLHTETLIFIGKLSVQRCLTLEYDVNLGCLLSIVSQDGLTWDLFETQLTQYLGLFPRCSLLYAQLLLNEQSDRLFLQLGVLTFRAKILLVKFVLYYQKLGEGA